MGRCRPLIQLCALLAAVALTKGCGDSDSTITPPPDPPRPTTVAVSPATAEFSALGASVQLTAEVRDQSGNVMAGAAVAWSSTAASVATVDAAGLVTAVANGTATITAASEGVSGTASVSVTQALDSVAVSPTEATIAVLGDTVRLAAAAFDANGHAVAGAEFSWESSDVAVATVDVSGLVTAVRGGNATITATYEENTAESVISVWISTLREGSVRVLYVAPADREFRDDYSLGVSRGIVDVQGWYRQQIGGLTFDVYSVVPEWCPLPQVHEYYDHGDVWEKVLADIQSCAPVEGDTERFTWVLYVDVEERCGEPHELGRGGAGLTMMGRGDLDGLSNPGPYSACDGGPWDGTLGRWMGGTAHELGHTFHLPHPPGCEEELLTCDRQALMWNGYENYPDTYLRDDEKETLRRSPFINGSPAAGLGRE